MGLLNCISIVDNNIAVRCDKIEYNQKDGLFELSYENIRIGSMQGNVILSVIGKIYFIQQ